MSIPAITSVTRIAPTVTDAPPALAPGRQAGAAPEVELDAVTQMPAPPRFPWLSRLSQQLAQVARQKPAFAAAPVLGDNLDRSV